tara:strand:- start:351 stop:605 length:255 start_codon:yes stop_codon:yes gene_type:complete
MTPKKELESLCYVVLIESPKTKKQINESVVNIILKKNLTHLIYVLNNLGFCLEALKKENLIANTAKCKDANEGLTSSAATWYIV